MTEDEIKSETIALLEQLISFESTIDHPDIIEKCLDWALGWCREQGMRVHKVSSLIGWAEVGDPKAELWALPLHLDVVPAGNGWHTPPFEMTIQDDKILGRGVYDNKGPAAMMMILVNHLKQAIENARKRVRLIFGTREEEGMDDIQDYLESEEMPAFGFVPDASFPVVLGEKGRVHFVLDKRDEKQAFENFVSGVQVNSVSDYAELTSRDAKLSSFLKENGAESKNETTIAMKGSPAHGSKPTMGDDAGLKLLKSLPEAAQTLTVKQILALDTPGKDGENLGISAPDRDFGDTTVNPGVITFDGLSWHMELDIRFGRTITTDTVIEKVRNFFGDWNVLVANQKDVHVVDWSPRLAGMVEQYKREFPRETTDPIYMGGGTYASHFPGMVAFGPKIESVHTRGHRSDEQLTIPNLEKTLKVYQHTFNYLLQEG